MKPLLTVSVDIDLLSENQTLREHWSKRKKRRKVYGWLLRAAFGRSTPFDHPVKITATRVLGKGQRPFDGDNFMGGSWKQVQDAMVDVGWLHDDTVKWLPKVVPVQDASKREQGPMLIIDIERAQ